MRIEGLSIENFTLFGKNQFKFSDGLNIIVGENDTGKSHLLRLLYSLIESNNLVQEGGNIQTTEKSDFLKKSDFFDFWVVRKLSPSCTSRP